VPGSDPPAWTTAAEIAARIDKLWKRGHLLVPPAGEALFPYPIRLSGPRAMELAGRYREIQAWMAELQERSRARLGFGYELDLQPIGARSTGANLVPVIATVPTLADAIALVGRQIEYDQWQRLLAATAARCQPLLTWVRDHPLTVLEHAPVWERFVAVTAWMLEHPRPGIYVRQVDLPGIDTKFIEANEGILRVLLECALPPEAIAEAADFAPRFGFLAKPKLLRFRFLDPRLSFGGLTDLAVRVEQAARLDLSIKRVVITENEINGLAFPQLDNAIVIFGLGYGIDCLAELPWLHRCDLWYWGDIDTHGLTILDQLRAHFPDAVSLLMDRSTLLDHRSQWVAEPAQSLRTLTRLTAIEAEVMQDLVENRWDYHVRLEQERVGFHHLIDAINRLNVLSSQPQDAGEPAS
jgi:hypothetical protein